MAEMEGLAPGLLDAIKHLDHLDDSDDDFAADFGHTQIPFVGGIEEVKDEKHLTNVSPVTLFPCESSSVMNGNADHHSKLSNQESEHLKTPIKAADCSGSAEEPLTPTANLKVLLHAASPEIRNYQRRKEMSLQVSLNEDTHQLQQPPITSQSSDRKPFAVRLDKAAVVDLKRLKERELFNNGCVTESGYDSENCENIDPNIFRDSSSSCTQYRPFSRKEKSLGLLCHKFLRLYPEYPKESISICLDDATTKLAVGRRRIYDIINVLEAIQIVTRLAKNNYTWRGRNGLTQTLCTIRRKAEVTGAADQLRESIKKLNHFQPLEPLKSLDPYANEEPHNDGDLIAKRRDKSLGILSEKFLTLFLVQPNEMISLEMAARVLITNGSATENKYKTKVRRLYDIANILTSLKLIKKVFCPRRKPAFRWIGPEVHYKPTPVKPSPVSPKFIAKSSASGLWMSPPFKMVVKDGGLSSLCEVAEQERRDMCFATPVKNAGFALATPMKGGGYVLVTPTKLTPTGELEVTVTATGNESCSRTQLESTLNSDDAFLRELESLRQRFPSPMSRLLSACSVQEALAQHKADPPQPLVSEMTERSVTEPISTRRFPQDEELASPTKVSLAYLERQQKVITQTVYKASAWEKRGVTHSGKASGTIIRCQPDSPRASTTMQVQPAVRASADDRVLVPITNVHFVTGEKQPKPMQEMSVKLSSGAEANGAGSHPGREQGPSKTDSNRSKTESLPQIRNLKYLVPLSQSRSKLAAPAATSKPIIKLKSCDHVGTNESPSASKPLTIYINSPSLSVSAEHARTTAQRPAAKSVCDVTRKRPATTIRLISGKDRTPANNFIKLDLDMLSKAQQRLSGGTNVKVDTCRPLLRNLNAASDHVIRKNKLDAKTTPLLQGSVVTNLVARLEQQGCCSSNNNGQEVPKPVKILHGVCDYTDIMKAKLQSSGDLEENQSESAKVKKRKMSSRKLKMSDETDDSEVKQLMMQSAEPVPIKPRAEKLRPPSNGDPAMKLDPLAVPIEAASEFAPFSNNWNRRKSAFSVARKKSRAPTPGKENKAASVTEKNEPSRDCSLFCPVSRPESCADDTDVSLPSPLDAIFTPSLANTPLSLAGMSRSASSISSISDLDSIFPDKLSRTASPRETDFLPQQVQLLPPEYYYCHQSLASQPVLSPFPPLLRDASVQSLQLVYAPTFVHAVPRMQATNNSTPKQRALASTATEATGSRPQRDGTKNKRSQCRAKKRLPSSSQPLSVDSVPESGARNCADENAVEEVNAPNGKLQKLLLV